MLTTGFQSVAPVTSKMVPFSLFILVSSVCKSLQCLISALTRGGKGGHLFRLTVQLCWGEGGNLQTNITGMLGSVCSAWTMLGLPQPKAVYTSWIYPAQAPGCPARSLSKAGRCFVRFPGLSCSGCWVLCKGTDLTGHAFCAFPKSEQLRRPGAW